MEMGLEWGVGGRLLLVTQDQSWPLPPSRHGLAVSKFCGGSAGSSQNAAFWVAFPIVPCLTDPTAHPKDVKVQRAVPQRGDRGRDGHTGVQI